MKHKLLRLSLLSIFSMFWGMVFAQEPAVTLDFTSQDNWDIPTSGTNTTLASFTDGTYTIKLCAADNYKLNNGYLIYGKNGSFLELPPFDFDVEKIEVVGRSGASASVKQVITNGNGALLNCEETTGAQGTNTYVLTGDDQKAGTYRILVSSAHNTQITKIFVYKVDASDTREATTMTLGEYVSTGEVGGTISLPSATVATATGALTGAEVSWESSNTEVATIGNGVINLLTVGTTTIKASYAGDNSYKPCDASYNVTVTPAGVTISSFSELQAKCTSTTATPATITFNGEQVVYVNGSNAYLADANGLGAMIYTSNHGLEAGQTLTGTIEAKIQLYQGAAEITGFSKEGLTIGTADVVPTEKTIGDITTAQQSTLVTLKNVTYNANEKIFYDEDSITYYDKFKTNVTLEDGKAYDVTGVVILYNQTIEICPRTADDVVEATTTVPEQWTWRDFAVQLTNDKIFDTSVNNFGVKVAEDGSYTAVAADDATANFVVNSARWNDGQHGWVNCTFTMKVNGPVLIKLGDCQFGAQTGTITDAENNVTELTKPAKQCWDKNNPDQNVVATYYRGLTPTTLTIKYDGYCPFISVTAIDPNDMPAEVTKYTVTFDTANSGAQGVAPDAITEDAGTEITIPQNYTLYKEGHTLTCWRDATGQPYAPGNKFTLQADMTLLPEFSQNEVSLADRTEPVTVKWNFRRDQGAPSVQWQNKDGLVWVAQATVNGKTIDVALPFSTIPGKFNNTNWTDWCQLNNGTTFTVPSCKDAVISMEAFSEITTTSIDGQTDYTQGKTISYTIAGSAETVDVVIGDGSYYRYIQVVLPVVQQQQGGESFDNEAATIEWPFNDAANLTGTANPESAFATVATNTGDLTINGTGTRTADDLADGVTFIKFKPAGSTTAVQWVVKPASGLTFTPTKVSMWIQRFGTDAENGVTITAKAGEGEAVNLGNFTAPRANQDVNKDKYAKNSNWTNHVEIELTAAQQTALASGDELVLSATVGVGSTKDGGFSDIIVEGLVNGTKADVAMYTLATAVAPAEAGTINVYPVSDQYEEGSEVTLTATENFGYDFVNWTNAAGEEVSTEAKFKYTVNSNETLTANFVAVETYELALTVDGTNDYMVTVEPAPTMVDGKMMYEAGQAVQLTANQYEDLVTFTNWSDGDTNSSKLISMTEDIKLTAMYAQADIIAGWDFYTAGGSGRKADFAAQDNDGDALNLVNTETGETSGWLDKSWLAAGGYESFKGAAVNWRTGTSNGDVGNWHWQTKVNAEAFTDINVQFQMLYNYNAYQTYNAEYSLDGENWTKFGTINMTGAKKVASFNKLMPADANNQTELYIRMIADKTSNVDGSASANDGNSLAMFFITGTPKLVDDGVAPVLVSTVPADGATGASATGKIVLTFDERVKLADTFLPTATLGNQTLTPAVSGKTVTFEYKGLEYSTEYTFTLPGGSIADLTNNFIQDAITLTFTTMVRPSVEKGLYDYVVENVDDLLAAISGAESRSDKNTRYRIFIKNGEYTIPVKANTLVAKAEGNEVPECITFLNASNVSFIGESRDGVIITNGIDKNATFSGQYGITSKYDGIGNSDVFQIGSRVSGLYWQDLTVETGMDDATGRDLAIQDKGTKNIYKNIGLRGYQDTWTSNNDNGLYYFEGGYVRGRTDYMCGKGDIFWNGVELRQIAGGYAAVPSKPAKYGWIYKDCVINGEGAIVNYADKTYRDASQVNNNYTLGRPWGSGTPIALFIDTRMNVVPSAIGWNEMSNGWPARFAEYNSTTSTGSVIDLSGRKKTFGDGHANNPVLTAEEALENSDLHRMYGDWDPTLATEQAPIPTNVRQEADSLKWDNSNYALLWAVVKDGNVIGFTVEPAFQLTEPGTYAVRAANEMGGLSEASAVVEVKTITTGIFETPNPLNQVPETIYNINGIRVQKAQHGLYIINGRKVVIK